ncbi:hypothetical protein GCM10027162_77800 [Streptomyces incanus]
MNRQACGGAVGPEREAGLILLPKEEIAARRVHFPWDGKMLPVGDAPDPRG